MFGFFNRGSGQGNGQGGNQDRQYDFGYDTETTASLTDSDSETNSLSDALNREWQRFDEARLRRRSSNANGSLNEITPIRRLSIAPSGTSSFAARLREAGRIEDAIDAANLRVVRDRAGGHTSLIESAIQDSLQRAQEGGYRSLLDRATAEQDRENRDSVFRSSGNSDSRSDGSDEMAIKRSDAFDQGDQSPPRGGSGGRAI